MQAQAEVGCLIIGTMQPLQAKSASKGHSLLISQDDETLNHADALHIRQAL